MHDTISCLHKGGTYVGNSSSYVASSTDRNPGAEPGCGCYRPSRKQFGKLRAVNDLSMTITTGETYGLIGPNGSGKTTLIRLLVGLMRPTSGTIRVMGQRIPSSKVSPHLGYMTQLSALYQDLTARENMQFFCNIYGLRGKAQQQRIAEMLERVDLADRANDVVSKFSGGMKQRLSLACSLVHRPRLALLDEPTV